MLSESDFDWVEPIEALSVTVVRGLDQTGLIERLNLRPLGARPMTLGAAFGELSRSGADYPEGGPCQIIPAGDWIALVEDNGYRCGLPGTLSLLSSGSVTAANVYWNVNMVTSFGYAVDGQVIRYFDPSGINGGYGARLADEAGLDFEDPDADSIALSFQLLERLTGVAIDETFVEQELPCYLLGEFHAPEDAAVLPEWNPIEVRDGDDEDED